jgi:hypothetical protein
MIVEIVLTAIIAAAVIYVMPGTLSLIGTQVPVCATNTALTTAKTSIGGIVGGGMTLGAMVMLSLGIAALIAGFVLVKGFRQN